MCRCYKQTSILNKYMNNCYRSTMIALKYIKWMLLQVLLCVPHMWPRAHAFAQSCLCLLIDWERKKQTQNTHTFLAHFYRQLNIFLSIGLHAVSILLRKLANTHNSVFFMLLFHWSQLQKCFVILPLLLFKLLLLLVVVLPADVVDAAAICMFFFHTTHKNNKLGLFCLARWWSTDKLLVDHLWRSCVYL